VAAAEDFEIRSSQLDYRPSQVELRHRSLVAAGDDCFFLHCSQTYTRNSSLHSGNASDGEEEGEEEVRTPMELGSKVGGLGWLVLCVPGVAGIAALLVELLQLWV
jgi:hypothetical protein